MPLPMDCDRFPTAPPMILSKKKTPSSVVGLDLDVDSVAAAERPQGGGELRGGVEPLPPGAIEAGEVVDAAAVSAALESLFSRAKLSKQVRIAVASQGVAFRTMRLPLIEDPEQLRSAVRFQAQEQIPMPLESAVLDHQVIAAHVGDDGSRQVDVAVVAARRESVSALLGAVRDAGLEPVGVDLAAFGMIRALAGGSAAPPRESAPLAQPQPGQDEYVPATLYASLGGITNLAIARNFACLFSRVAQFGVRDIALELAGKSGLSLEHAEQWLVHSGFAKPLEEIEGDAGAAAAAREALEANVGKLADELRLSLDYYGGQDGASPVGDIVLCGWGSAIGGLPEQLSAILGREVTVGKPVQLADLSAAEAARLTLPYGLSLEQ